MTACIRRPRSTWPSCRCPECVEYKRRLRKRANYGIGPERPSDAAWERVDEWIRLGWTPGAIASVSRLPQATIRGAIEKRSRWSTASALAILSAAAEPTSCYVPAIGTGRRIRALAALGHTEQDIATAAGLPLMTVSSARKVDRARVHVTTAAAVKAAYEQLSMRIGTSEVSRAHARRQMWPPPLAWDDEKIDNPSARPNYGYGHVPVGPDRVTIARVLAGECVATTTPDREYAIPLLAAQGLSDSAIADLCRTSAETVLRTRRRLGVKSTWLEKRLIHNVKQLAS